MAGHESHEGTIVDEASMPEMKPESRNKEHSEKLEPAQDKEPNEQESREDAKETTAGPSHSTSWRVCSRCGC